MVRIALACALLASWPLSESGASVPIQVRAGLELGLGGVADVEQRQGSVALVDRNDLVVTGGFRVQGDLVLHDVFSIGVQSVVRWVNTTAADQAQVDPSVLVGFNLVPTGRWPLTRRLTLLLSVPIGVDITLPSADLNVPEGTAEGGTALSAGLLAGAQWFLTDLLGAYLQIGFRTVNLAVTQTIQAQQVETTVCGLQFHLSIGGVIGF